MDNDYLLNLKEQDVLKITPIQAYKRSKLLAQLEQNKNLNDLGYIPPNQRKGFASPKTSGKKKPYKSWIND